MLVAILLLPLQLAAQPVLAQLPAADRVLDVTFAQIRGVRELPDGRVLISDRIEERVVVANFVNGTVHVVGRVGPGPGEYHLPTTLSPMPGDSTLLLDEGNSRIAVIGPDLKIHRSFTLQVPGLGVALGARGVDVSGRFTLQIPGWVRASGPKRDTVRVIRFTERSRKVDTVTFVQGMSPSHRDGRKPGFPFVMFAAQDVWAVGIDGRVAAVRAADYHVDWYLPDGTVLRGPPVRGVDPVPVSAEERLVGTREFLANSSTSGKNSGDAMSALPAEMRSDAAVRDMVAANDYAAVKGPFTDTSPIIAPDGSLWVERSVRLNAPSQWDVFDAAGILTRRVQLPAMRRLAAVGRGTIYLVATDADGLQRLERVRR